MRAVARSESISDLRVDGVETVVGDLLEGETRRRALEDATTVVHIGPTANQHEVAIGIAVADAAEAAGIERFVLFSVYHPQIEYLINHQNKARVEDFVVASPLPYTILQPMHYLQNVDPAQVAREGVLRLPYSMERKLSFVDLADVAEVCAKVIVEDSHRFATYPLCGPDHLSGLEVADLIAARTGVPVAAESIEPAAFLAFLDRQHPLGHYQRAYLSRLFGYYDACGLSGTMAGYIERSLETS